MNTDNIIPCILKVTASSNVDIENDLNQPESAKSIEQLLNEQIQEEKNNEKD